MHTSNLKPNYPVEPGFESEPIPVTRSNPVHTIKTGS